VANFPGYKTAENYYNLITIYEVMAKTKRVPVFLTQCRCRFRVYRLKYFNTEQLQFSF